MASKGICPCSMLYRQCLLDDFLSNTQWIEDLIDTVKKICCHISKLSSCSQSTEICASGKNLPLTHKIASSNIMLVRNSWGLILSLVPFTGLSPNSVWESYSRDGKLQVRVCFPSCFTFLISWTDIFLASIFICLISNEHQSGNSVAFASFTR